VLVKLCGIDQNIAYIVQAVAAIEASFILNRFINWRDRSGKLYNQWIKFHTTKIGTVILNQILFGILVAHGFHYLLATLIGVGVATIINYVTNDRLVFAPRKWDGMPAQRLRSYRLDLMPKVGVVIPVRNSHRTIRQCVESALKQDYRGEFTIFIVGNSEEQDTTWETLGDLTQHFKVKCLYISRPTYWVGRDANMKRYFGCVAATNAGFDVIAFLDSQVMAPTNWLSSALQQMDEKCVDGIAGISCRNPEDCSMSGIYQDGSLFSEWPRFGLEYFLSKETFGQAKGLPITANMLISKQVFECIQKQWPMREPYGWEDFLLSWEIASEGFTLLCTDTIRVYRNHKRKFRLSKTFSSGMAAITFYYRNPDCEYIQRRFVKATCVLIAPVTIILFAIILATLGGPAALLWFGLALGIGVGALVILNLIKARDWRGIFFFPLDAIHISLWIAGAIYLLSKRGKINTALADLLVKTR
jgi:putative flippase GtrA/glycosyltransferase involved in cell wall biosynthesis